MTHIPPILVKTASLGLRFQHGKVRTGVTLVAEVEKSANSEVVRWK